MQIGELLNLLQKPKRQADGSFLALCPAHADKKTLSLHVSQKDTALLLRCFAGCTTDAICDSLKIELSDLFTEHSDVKPSKQPRIIATYSYTDEQGIELYQKVRYEPKDFRQRHKVGTEWVWNLNGARRVLYRLPELLSSKDVVYYVEGEKDVENLRAIGKVATTSGGAQDWRPDFADVLKGREVVLIPDRDAAGLKHAQDVSTALAGKAAVRVIMLEGYKDISDYLQAGRSFYELHTEDVSILSAPSLQFQNKGSRYLFSFEGYQAEVSKIKSARDTTVCQLVIYPRTGITFRTKFNLESDRTRSMLAKELGTRFKGPDWKSIVEDITNRTLEEFEKGEPVVEIQSQEDVADLEYLVGPIIPLGKPTVFFGDPGSGKSQLAIVLNLVTSFESWYPNPLRLTPPKRPMRCLVLDWEADEDDWRRQLKWFTEAFNQGWCNLFYRRCSLSLAHDLDAIKAHIEAVHADWVLIDSVSLAAGGDLNHMDVATGYFRAIRQLVDDKQQPLTTVSLAHTSKDRDSKNKTILGSVLFEAGARNVWEVRGQEDDNALDIALFHRKSNLSRKHSPLGYKITYKPSGPDSTRTIPESMAWHDPNKVEEFVEHMGPRDRIIRLLMNKPVTEEEIVSQLGLARGTVSGTLSRLKTAGLALRKQDKWGWVQNSV